MTFAQYSLLLINPTIDRVDTVVAGVVVRHPGGWDVRVAASAAKMKAIDPTFPDSRLVQTSELTNLIAKGLSSLPELRQALEGVRLGLILHPFVGVFSFDSQDEYHDQVRAVLGESVNPPTLASANAAPITRRRNVVRRKLRDHFRARGLWSRNDEDIDKHRVVEHFPISAAYGLIADFALKNGVMHITETIDFQVQSLTGKRIEAQAKTLVLTEAVKVFGAGTRRYVVAAGTSQSEIQSSVALLRENAEVFALESSEEMTRYVDRMASVAAFQVQL